MPKRSRSASYLSVTRFLVPVLLNCSGCCGFSRSLAPQLTNPYTPQLRKQARPYWAIRRDEDDSLAMRGPAAPVNGHGGTSPPPLSLRDRLKERMRHVSLEQSSIQAPNGMFEIKSELQYS